MDFELVLELVRTFSGAQLAVIARHVGFDRHIAGARLRSAVVQADRKFAIFTFDVLYVDHAQQTPAVLLLSVRPSGFEVLF